MADPMDGTGAGLTSFLDYTGEKGLTYKTRFRSGVNMYRGFLQDPGGWRPSKSPRPATNSSSRRRANDHPEETSNSSKAPPPPSDEASERPDMMTYPFPLRRDGNVVFARLILPNDLTPGEAKRIAAH